MADDTLLRKRGIQRRMKCDGATATRIEDAFVTVEKLVAAVEADAPLTGTDGIGPATAETIREWWAVRFAREDAMSGNSVERTGAKTATIHFHTSWAPVLDDTEADTE